jgi:hypothetical protein
MIQIRKLVLFAALVIGIDQVSGYGLDSLYRRTTSGEVGGGLINLALVQDPDILVLGSSRAQHHISPAILRDDLSMTVFNAGVNGQDFLYAVMLLDLWTRSHRPPAAIVVNMDSRSLLKSGEELDRASVFGPYFDDSRTVQQILLMRGRYARLKYLSYAYRFNGKVLPILKNLVIRPAPGFDGYLPLGGSLAGMRLPANGADEGQEARDAGIDGTEKSRTFWDFKLGHLEEIATYCRKNGTRLFLVTGPVLKSNPEWAAAAQQLSSLPSRYPGVEFLDLSERTHPEAFAGQPQLYADNTHLNARGAAVFSHLLADEIAGRMRGAKALTVRRGKS